MTEGPFATPADTANPPGRAAIAWRVGTWSSFRASMLAGIARDPRLAALSTRSADDPAVALVDAFAAALDVLSFYQERIANEGWLRTATERRSVRALARGIGYEPSPGVAASTVLAFEMETLPGTPDRVALRPGLPARSTPGQDELPQVFETSLPLDARRDWGRLPVVSRIRRPPQNGDLVLPLDGAATGVSAGDQILVADLGDGTRTWAIRRAAAVAPDPTAPATAPRTLVTLDAPLTGLADDPADGRGVFVLRARAAPFGANAPDWSALSAQFREDYAGASPAGNEWPNFGFGATFVASEGRTRLALDAEVPLAIPGAFVVLRGTHATEQAPGRKSPIATRVAVRRIKAVETRQLTGFAISARVSVLTFDRRIGSAGKPFPGGRRNTAVQIAGPPLALADFPLAEAGSTLQGDTLDIALPPSAMPPVGRLLALSGSAPDASAVAETATIATVTDGPVAGTSRVRLTRPLRHAYRKAALVVFGNAVPATQGETRGGAAAAVRPEVLGSGDGGQAFQSFRLRQAPLTFLPAEVPGGRAAALELRVNGLRWTEVPNLQWAGPADRVYTLRVGEDGVATVRFGDGITGARLPTGQANVTARYRVGLGPAGNLAAGRIDQVGERPLGLKAVLNPVPASGAEPAESLADARRNAPGTVLTLDRIVSVADFAAFAAAFAGIGKAAATLLVQGGRRLVQVTVTGAGGSLLDEAGETLPRLRRAIAGARPPGLTFAVAPHVPAWFGLVAELQLTADARRDLVEPVVQAVLVDRFGFAARAFGQAAAPSEIVAAIAGVPGVAGVRLRALEQVGSDGAPPPETQPVGASLPPLVPLRARFVGDAPAAAELLLLAPTAVALLPWSDTGAAP